MFHTLISPMEHAANKPELRQRGAFRCRMVDGFFARTL